MQQITNFKATVFPLIFPCLADSAETHWNTTVAQLTLNVQKLLMEIDSELYDAEAVKYTEAKATAAERERERTQQWDELAAMAGA